MRHPAPLRTALAAALALMGPACAATSQVARLEDEVRRLQRVVDELQKSEAELKVRVEELGGRVALPAEAFELQLEETVAEVGAEHAAPVEKPPAGASPHEMYNAAFTRFNLGQHPEAIELFGEFLAAYPKHDLADNAQYWIGECLYARHEYEEALEEFQKVVDHYPSGNKVPDAFVKRGLALLELDRRAEAIENLQTVIEAYPRSDAATYARQRLAELLGGAEASSARP